MNPITPAAPSAAPEQESAGTVCISPQADGTYMVYQEGAGPDAGGAQEETDEQAGGQKAPDVAAALEIARQMLGAGNAQQEDAGQSADDLFSQGFNNARGNPLGRG